jgi:hypothetical protein
MELGMNSLAGFKLLNASTIGAINASQQMGQFIAYSKLNSLNSTCLSLGASPSMFIIGFKTDYKELTNYEIPALGYEENLKIHDFLKEIPIYQEVVSFKSKDIDCAPKILSYPISASPQLQCNAVNPTNYRKRTASDFCRQDNEIYSASTPKILSTAQSYSDQNSSSESSSPLEKHNAKKRILGNKTRNINYGFFDANVEFTKSCTAYVPTQSIANYNPVFIAKGANTLIPSRYVQLQKEKDSLRKTKVVTSCEHTDRKHYAKGLCSTCYHKNGRTKTAWNCMHTNMIHYAKGCCQECYITFHSKRGQNKKRKMMYTSIKNLTKSYRGDNYQKFSPSDLL